jgi:hypothetical protein
LKKQGLSLATMSWMSPKRLNLRKTLKVAASAIWASHKHVRQGAPRRRASKAKVSQTDHRGDLSLVFWTARQLASYRVISQTNCWAYVKGDDV